MPEQERLLQIPVAVRGVEQPPQSVDEEYELVEEDWADTLPHVDDLEVAAAAAEAVLEAENLRAATAPSEASSEVSSTEWETTSEESSQESAGEGFVLLGKPAIQNFAQTGAHHVAVSLEVAADDHVHIRLEIQSAIDDGDSEAGSEVVNAEELRDMLARMVNEGEDAKAAAREENGAGFLPVKPLNVTITAEDKLLPAGVVSSVLEGTLIIVQAPVNCQPIDEGSVLCLSPQAPLGRVEEIFGPVEAPLYILRYSAQGDVPAELAVGAKTFSVERLNSYVFPESLKAGVEEVLDDDTVEPHFSDDDAEAVFQRHSAGIPSVSYSRDQPAMPFSNHSHARGMGRTSGGRSPTPSRGRTRGSGGGEQRGGRPTRGRSPNANPVQPHQSGARGPVRTGEGRFQRGRGRLAQRGRQYAPAARGYGGYGAPYQMQSAQMSAPPPSTGQGRWVWIPPQADPQMHGSYGGANPVYPEQEGGDNYIRAAVYPDLQSQAQQLAPAQQQQAPPQHQNFGQSYPQFAHPPSSFYPQGLP